MRNLVAAVLGSSASLEFEECFEQSWKNAPRSVSLVQTRRYISYTYLVGKKRAESSSFILLAPLDGTVRRAFRAAALGVREGEEDGNCMGEDSPTDRTMGQGRIDEQKVFDWVCIQCECYVPATHKAIVGDDPSWLYS
jgi:hypothetical protein